MTTIAILRLPDVLQQTGLSRSTIYEMISRGDFPRQVKPSRRAVGWMADEIDLWNRQKTVLRPDNCSRVGS